VRAASVGQVVGNPIAGDDDEFDVLDEEGAEGFGPGEICLLGLEKWLAN